MVENLLKNHSLRITHVRKSILGCFANSDKALSHSDIEQFFSDEFDRVTIYRTLNSFLDKGLLHKVPDDTQVAKFALCHQDCNEHHHYDNHVHFKCEKCLKVQCFHEVKIPTIPALKDYTILSANLLIHGICNACKLEH